MIDPLEAGRLAWRTVRDHPLRSTLTTLGVMIGVAAVITFVTLGAGLQADIVNTIVTGDAGTMYVSAAPAEAGDVSSLRVGGPPVFTERDVYRIRGIRGVEAAVPRAGIATAGVTYHNDTVARQWVTVTTPEYFRTQGLTFTSGQPFTPGAREVVLNEPAAEMFGENVSVGDRIVIAKAATGERVNATVVGIVEAPERGVVTMSGPKPAIYAPPDPFYQRTAVSPSTNRSQQVFPTVVVTASDPRNVEEVRVRIASYLTEHSDARKLAPKSYDLEVVTRDERVSQIRKISGTFTAYVAGVAVISLLVGAIGIANVMLVSVTERTREIGIMKAVGARNRDILGLFLVESVLLGAIGSVLGAIGGILGGYAGARIIGLPVVYQPVWVVVAVAVGVLVGAVAGIYPAWRAARTDPIDALRGG